VFRVYLVLVRIQFDRNLVLPIRMSTQFRYNRGAQMTQQRRKGPRLRHRGETSSLSTAQAETPRPRDRPGEYTPHVRLYPAHAYPIQNVATALQSAHSDRRRSLRVFLGLARVPVHK